jgi:type I restriction-modification system DNA methylase subunit
MHASPFSRRVPAYTRIQRGGLGLSTQAGVRNLSPTTLSSTSFDEAFWTRALNELGYPLSVQELDINTLKEQGAIPSGVSPASVKRLYADKYVEVALLSFKGDTTLTRGTSTRIARLWKQKRMMRPLLLFTNGSESFATVVPGAGTAGEVKVLALADMLYRTDREALASLGFPTNAEELKAKYDTEFLPYEKVRKEFFEGYRDLYQKIRKAVEKHLSSHSTAYTQRFLGRLMFLYFLQRKGWLRGDKKFVDSISDYVELNRIFYESLNRRGTPGIPFLNGSLFEREDYMTAEMEAKLADVMDPLLKEAREFFDQYNFTVDETAPLEVEVSIDPALIGTVFENMLPEYERGSKGTFYTPRSESSFICRRALSNYLGFRDEISADGKKFIDGLNVYLDGLKKRKSEKEVREFKERLLSIKVLDPAVGSGGFLLVMMQEIIGLLQEADSVVGWRTDVQEYKKRILPNLYGFDIEAEAIEIARLRLWLSLTIDQKEPEPLPNLDINLIVIEDSLRLSVGQQSIDAEIQSLQVEFSELRGRYLNEHDAGTKKALKQRLQQLGEEIRKRTGEDPNVIEAHLQGKADIVVMNPPYVRQESIDPKKKYYYSTKYGIDKKSDLYAYFLMRALRLVTDTGVVSVISSDKWLETGYGVSVQKNLKINLIAVYGQRERSFGADINTVITVLGKQKVGPDVQFVYLDSYSRDDVRQYIRFERKELEPGKWFYLRPGAKFFIEKLLPKLTHKLSDFVEIKRGFTTGANEFFYMKDVSHLFEADRLADPKKFEELGVKAKTREELEKQGLIYIENEGGERFVIDRDDTKEILRGPEESNMRIIDKLPTLMLYTDKPKSFTEKYIQYGEQKKVLIKKGKDKGKVIEGVNHLATLSNRYPWYSFRSEIRPAHVLLIRFIQRRHFDLLSADPILTDQTANLAYPRFANTTNNLDAALRLWLYCNSSFFILAKEMYGMRMGGGGGVLQLYTEAFEGLPVIDLNRIEKPKNYDILEINPIKDIFEELDLVFRKRLDSLIARSVDENSSDELISELHSASCVFG